MKSACSPEAFDYACVFVLGPGNQAKIDLEQLHHILDSFASLIQSTGKNVNKQEMLKWKRQKASGAVQKSSQNNIGPARHSAVLHNNDVAVYKIQNKVTRMQNNNTNVQHSFLTLKPQVITFDRGKLVSKKQTHCHRNICHISSAENRQQL